MKNTLALFAILFAMAVHPPAFAAERAETGWTNPLVPQRADPQVSLHDGWYYLAATVPEYDRLEIRRARTIDGLSTATPKTVWNRHANGPMSGFIWAPELHFIDGKPFIYFSAGEAPSMWNIFLYAIECKTGDPMAGEWIERGRIKTAWDSFTLDATVFEHHNTRYMVWAQQPRRRGGTDVYIAKMDTPVSITGPVVRLTAPELEWERRGGVQVNEGPAVLIRNGKVFITYSASATDANYCLGLLTADENANLLDAKSWAKSQSPVFVTSKDNSQFGPGHNSFTTTPDGQTDVMVYHARSYEKIEGDPLRNRDRATRAQVVMWKADGTPDFGVPVKDGKYEVPVSTISNQAPLIDSVPRPILDGFNADPSIRVFGDTYYIYPTSDKPNWNTTDFSVWSSKNLVDWKKEGMILDVTKDLAWAKLRAWAPDCVERNGKYYFYFCADTKIGVGVSDKPTGPFKDALGQPLVKKGGKVNVGQTIDPAVFIDDDGQAYLYYGNGHAQVFKLKPDMLTLDGDPVDIQLKDFREGIIVFKRNGKYYFMWSIDDARSPDYRVGYGISDTPFGPVKSPEKDFIVLHRNGNAVATAHHGVVNVPGTDRWYVAYHRHAVPDGSGYKREVCLARMEFNPDGTIKPMDPLVTPFKPGDEGEPLVNGKGRPDQH